MIFQQKWKKKEERAELFSSSDYFGQCKRVTLSALPILSLSSRVSTSLTFFSNSARSITCLKNFYDSKNNSEKLSSCYHSALSLTSLAAIFFSTSAAMAITSTHDLSAHIFRLALALKEKDQTKACKEVEEIVNHSFYLLFLLYGSLEVEVFSLLIQVVTEALACLDEYKDQYYLEAASRLVMTTMRAYQLKRPATELGKKWKVDMLCQKAAWYMFSFAHKCSTPAHDLSYSYHLLSNGKLSHCSTTEKVKKLANSLIKLSIVIPATIASLSFSTLGSLSLKLSGKNYLYYEHNPDHSSFTKDRFEVMTYNIGELPGELSEKLTVRDDFPYTYEERKVNLADYLDEQFKQKDLIVLQEAVDFSSIALIKDKLEGISFSFYARIGEPLNLGIASGLAVISKQPLPDFTVKTLPDNEPFFNRSVALFSLPDGSTFVTAHLRAGSDDRKREKQMSYIASLIDQAKRTIFAGDYNFSDNWDVGNSFNKPKDLERYLTEETTIYNPCDNETHPDLIAQLNPKGTITYNVQSDVDLSDHFPIEFSIPMEEANADRDIS